MNEKQKEKKRKRKERATSLNSHHILPSSRGGDKNGDNMTKVNIFKHRDYHQLFYNLTPDEIIIFLVNYFWKGQTKWVRIALKKLDEV